MVKLRRGMQPPISEGASLRLRAAWLYYNHGLTQKDVAEQLGLSRTTVIRLLDEALKRGEVQIWIAEGDADCIALALQLEKAFGLDEAIVVPTDAENSGDIDATSKAVGLALGKFLSEVIRDDFTIGLGWGRTLTASLASFRPVRRTGVKVVSLLGGVMEAHYSNPIEYTWRMASQIGAECYLFLAPLMVDSAETRQRLIEKCGLDTIYDLAAQLDLAVISVGDIGPNATSLSRKLMTDADVQELIDLGCVADTMCTFLDAEGRTVPHPINERVMSVDLDRLRTAEHIVIACGGASRAVAIQATIKRTGCNTLVTDEAAARALLALSP